MLNVIATVYHNSMLVCFQEFIIKDDCPLSVIDFSMTMGHECAAWAFSTQVLRGECFKCIWKLSVKKEGRSHTGAKLMRSFSPFPDR